MILAAPRVCPKPILIIPGLFTRISALIAEINMLVAALISYWRNFMNAGVKLMYHDFPISIPIVRTITPPTII